MKAGNERPVNATAARVIARGESFEFESQMNELLSAVPLPIRKVTQGAEDYTGNKFGRLTVVGKADGKKHWVCRCVCGNYVYRKPKAIVSAASDAGCCECTMLSVMKRREFVRRTGKHKEREEFI